MKNDTTSTQEPSAGNLAGPSITLTRSPLFFGTIVALLTFTVFARILSADFVMWDDDNLLYNKMAAWSPNPENLFNILTHQTIANDFYSPLIGLKWSAIYYFFEGDPFGFHLADLLLHTSNAVLVFLLLRKLLHLGLPKPVGTAMDHGYINGGCAIGALIWSLHPLRVEPTAWVSGNIHEQALFFMLLSLLCYLRANSEETVAASNRKYYIASLFLYAASLLSQVIGLLFVVILLTLDVYPLNRVGGRNGWWENSEARRALLEKLPFIGIATAVVVLNMFLHIFLTHQRSTVSLSLADFPLLDRAMQALYILAYYLWKPWYPIDLSPVYTTLVSFQPLSLPFIASGVLVIGTAAMLILARRRWPLGLALGVCYLAILLPNLGFFEHPYYHNDRYSLVVSICFSILLAALLANPRIKRSLRSAAGALSIVFIIILSVLSYKQAGVWNNSETFFKHMLATLGDDPYRSDIHWRLGVIQAKMGKIDDAMINFRETEKLEPDHRTANFYIAQILRMKGRLDEAVVYFKRCLLNKPMDANIHKELAKTLVAAKRTEEAEYHFNKARTLKAD